MTNVREIEGTVERVERPEPPEPEGYMLIRWDGHYQNGWVVDSAILWDDAEDAFIND